MKRAIAALVLSYFALALVGRRRERQGRLSCDCLDGCWCKQPSLSLFRWVFPFAHRFPDDPTARQGG